MPDRYRNIKLSRTESGKSYYANPIYPTPSISSEDLWVVTSEGDRWDLLAKSFYGDASLWWILASLSPQYADSMVLPPGVQLRIPHSPQQVREEYEQQNRI